MKKMTNKIPQAFRVVANLASGTNLNEPVSNAPVTLSDAAPRAVVVTDDYGTSTALDNSSVAIGGLGATAFVQAGLAFVLGPQSVIGPDGQPTLVGGLARGGARGVTIVGQGPGNNKDVGTARTGDGGIALALHGGSAFVEGRGLAIAMNDRGSFGATTKALKGAWLILGYCNPKSIETPLQFAIAKVDGKKIKENTPYRVTKRGRIVRAN